MIWAEAAGRVIGAGGRIPWRIPGEQAMFKERTMGDTVVMGRATWDSLPARARPLPGRRNVVLTRDPDWSDAGAEVAHSVAEVDASKGEIWIIGGAAIYAEFLPLATHILRTRVDLRVDGDTRAPELGDDWVVSSDSGWQEAPDGTRYIVEELVRGGRDRPGQLLFRPDRTGE
jgi:dihydrofolate reductase